MIRIYLEHGSQVSHTNDKNETMMALLHFCWLVVVKNNFLACIRIRVRIEMLGWIRIRLKRIRFSSTATVVRKATARLFRLKILITALMKQPFAKKNLCSLVGIFVSFCEKSQSIPN